MGLYTGDNKRGNNKIKNCMVLQTGGLYGGGAYIRGFTVLHDFFIRLF